MGQDGFKSHKNQEGAMVDIRPFAMDGWKVLLVITALVHSLA